MSQPEPEEDLLSAGEQDRSAPDAVPLATSIARLFEAHNHSLHSFLMARLGNEQEVQEVTQEAYARLLQLHQLGAISFLRAYLFKTAVNIVVDRARQRRSRENLDHLVGAPELVDSVTPDRHVLASEELAIVEQALYELPPKYRRAFIMRRYNDNTPEHIAKELDIGARMVRNYICRATIYCKLRLEGVSAPDARHQVIP